MKSAKYLAGAFGSGAFVLALGISQSLNIQSSGLQAQEASGGGAGALASGGGSSGSKTEKTVDLQLFRTVGDDGADAPTGRGFLRMPASGPVASAKPETETGEPSVEPSEPETESDGAHQFFDEPIAGKCVFVIDVSVSMGITDVGSGEDYDGNVVSNLSRLMLVKTELINFLKQSDEGDFFDIVWLAGTSLASSSLAGASLAGPSMSGPNTDVWAGELVQCTEENREAAIEAVKDQTMWYGTPTWKALYRACLEYEDDLSVMVLLTDGTPFPFGEGEWGADTHVNAIHKDFPVWFAGKKDNGCKLIGVHVGQCLHAGSFMQDWCAGNDATYVHK